ncbi:HupE/UreJ family protein [Rhizobium sp. Leaf341]|uniref:HupE/UreJ family protein n=1 Tax=Rhizobium sp. Leaf341 TaxID=1736344 RepID=UPI000712A658|nr:HupE/UreJ family protein [Rhizobium sp. Leaf341]KQR69495.1 protein hupE [Rhizobium sp. Leaf341]
MTRRFLAAAAAAFALSAAPAFAHIDPTAHGSVMAGIVHPLSGLDHVLVMVAVGLWAAQLAGRARLAVPVAFVAMMAIGFALALSGMHLAYVEPAILASIVALGLLVAMAVRMPAAAGAGVVGIFALFHGYAHGGELGAATALAFGFGFALSTAALHTVGIALGMLVGRLEKSGAIARGLGVVTAAAGAALFIAG